MNVSHPKFFPQRKIDLKAHCISAAVWHWQQLASSVAFFLNDAGRRFQVICITIGSTPNDGSTLAKLIIFPLSSSLPLPTS